MIVRAIHDKDHPFFFAYRDAFQNPALSWAARGLLAFLLSQADTWEPKTEDLKTRGDLGRDGIRDLLTELEKAGHLTRARLPNEYGRFEWGAIVYENPNDNPIFRPVPEKPSVGTLAASPSPEKPSPVKPSPGLPSPEKPSPYKGKNTHKGENTEKRESVRVRECVPAGQSARESNSTPAHTPTLDSQEADPYEHEAVKLFEKVLAVRPAIFAAEQIAATVADLAQWEETLAYWNHKKHRKNNVRGMLDNYRRHTEQAAAIIGPVETPPVPEPTDAERLATVQAMAQSNELEALQSLAAQITERGGPRAEWEFFVCDFLSHQQRPALRLVR